MTILDRGGGPLGVGGGGGGGGGEGGCFRVEPWGNVTYDMAKKNVQKHRGKCDRMSLLRLDRHDQIKTIITNLDLINLY